MGEGRNKRETEKIIKAIYDTDGFLRKFSIGDLPDSVQNRNPVRPNGSAPVEMCRFRLRVFRWR
jgi:hypothetical protein